MRHAEALPGKGKMPDYLRPLTYDGVQSVILIGEFLKNKNIGFDSIITSHAVRAFETALHLAGQTAFPEPQIIEDKRLYNSGIDSYYDVIFEQSDAIAHLLVVGHNPQITGLANGFLKEKETFLFPANMASFCFQTDKWSDIRQAESACLFVWPAKAEHGIIY